MNDLEARLRASLRSHGTVEPATMPSGTSVRVRARRLANVAGTGAVLAVFVVGVAWAIPHGSRSPQATPADGTNPPPPIGWPTVVVGDPSTAYIGSFEGRGVVGDVHLLTSGTVDGAEFSLVGYSEQSEGLEVCLQMAGPASDGPPASPGPQPPNSAAATGGVGAFCLAERMPAQLLEMGWPDFPTNADLFVRTWGQESEVEYLGFVTDRVERVEVHLADGSVLNVPLFSFPNAQHSAAFILFPPSLSIDGTLEALDAGGTVLASASFCPPDDGVRTCDVLPTNQLVPVTNTDG